jgi:hypothetical protein
MRGRKRLLVPLGALALRLADGAGEEAGEQRDAEEDQHRLGDLPHGDVEPVGVEAEPAGQHVEVEPAEHREGDDLEHRVDRHEHRAELAVAAGQVVPDQHHRDAAGEADDDQPGAYSGRSGRNSQARANISAGPTSQFSTSDSAERPAVGELAADPAVLHLGQHRVHHRSSPIAIGSDTVSTFTLEGVVRGRGTAGRARCRPCHREADPHRQVAVEGGELLGDGRPSGGEATVDHGQVDGAAEAERVRRRVPARSEVQHMAASPSASTWFCICSASPVLT